MNPTEVEQETDGWEPPEGFDPTEAIMRNLVAKSKGNEVNEDEVEYASILLACQALVSRGVSIDSAMRAVESASTNGEIRIRYSEEDGLEVTIERDDKPDGLVAKEVVGPLALTLVGLAMTWAPDALGGST